MGHHHGHNHNSDTKNLAIAFLLNLSFTIIEIIGGFFTNSVAILSDAIHDLGDTFSLGLAWYFQKISKRERTSEFSYGYKRYSVLGALINGLILFAGCIFIFTETIPRLMHPEDVDPFGMMFLSILGIVINSLAVLRLKKGTSLNERVVYLHLLEDVLGWVAVFIGAIVILIWDLKIIDPILSIAIALYILFNIYKNLKSTLKVILQQTPDNVDFEKVQAFLRSKEQFISVQDLHVWSLDGEYNIMTVNIKVNDSIPLSDATKLKDALKKELLKFNIHHATIEFC
ncbi:MAG: cation diffusion facilitator family transporter [Crocinitomicaceae bacterium]